MKIKKLILSITAVFCVTGVYLYFTRNTMERVTNAATSAFNRGDVDAILALTTDDEIKQCNLTRENVRNMLNETLWQRGIVRSLRCWHFDGPGYADDEQFLIYPSLKKQRPIMVIWVADSIYDNKWHLGLSYTLSSCCAWNSPASISTVDNYNVLAQKYGIKGRWMNQTGFIPATGQVTEDDHSPN